MLRTWWFGFAVAAGGCGTARMIHQDQEGGVIQLDGDRDNAIRNAVELMALQCGANNFHLVSQGDEPVGTSLTTTSRDGSASEVRPVMAWRIHYLCGSAAAP
jgi:hypothetical protein